LFCTLSEAESTKIRRPTAGSLTSGKDLLVINPNWLIQIWENVILVRIMADDVGILVLGHGSTKPYNKEMVETCAKMIGDFHDGPVRIAFLNMDEPNIAAGLESFSGTKVKTIVALPIFLAHGVHTLEDIPNELRVDPALRRGECKLNGDEVEIRCAEPLGVDDCIASLAYRRAKEALK
jgi:sirohydrochlorin ferrochelatase